jgi:hypothetical protein
MTYHGRASVGGDLALARGGSDSVVYGEIAGNGPFRSADTLSGLIQLGGHVEIVNGGLLAGLGVETDERVDLEIGKVEVNINSIETSEKVDEGVALFDGHVDEKGVCDDLAGGEGSTDWDGEDESLRVDIANVDAALVCEEDRVALTSRVDADVIFGVGRMREEGFYDEIVECSGDGLDLRSHVSGTLRVAHDGTARMTRWSICGPFVVFQRDQQSTDERRPKIC